MKILLTRLAKEPIVHFILIGIVLFAIDQYWVQAAAEFERSQITIERHRLQELHKAFVVDTGRQPETAEWARIVEEEIQLEVLYREALAMDLHHNDPVTKHRLAEKATFVYEHKRRPNQPFESPWYADLRAKFEIHVEDFESP